MREYPDKKIEIMVSGKNEGTSAPWWIIIDPRQNFDVGDRGLSNIAHMITGPFFSREEANQMLEARRHHYSKHAVVYCHSGHGTREYANKVRF